MVLSLLTALTDDRRPKTWSSRNVVSSSRYSTCTGADRLEVDVAAKERDPLRRIAFVAAFAMSNYSSTIGRIAKPFNPMLVRHDTPLPTMS